MLNTCTSEALVETLRFLKRAYWPFAWDSFSGGFRGAASAYLDGAGSAEMEAIARTAAHRLDRGIWTSPGAGDLRRALAAAERLVLLRGDEEPDLRRDLSVLYLHCGRWEGRKGGGKKGRRGWAAVHERAGFGCVRRGLGWTGRRPRRIASLPICAYSRPSPTRLGSSNPQAGGGAGGAPAVSPHCGGGLARLRGPPGAVPHGHHGARVGVGGGTSVAPLLNIGAPCSSRTRCLPLSQPLLSWLTPGRLPPFPACPAPPQPMGAGSSPEDAALTDRLTVLLDSALEGLEGLEGVAAPASHRAQDTALAAAPPLPSDERRLPLPW